MDRFKNILFVLTDQRLDEFSFEHARKLAETNNAKLSVLGIYEPISFTDKISLEKRRVKEINQALEKQVNQRIEELIDKRRQHLKEVIIIPLHSPFEIIKKVLEHDFDLVIKSKENFEEQGHLSRRDMRLLRKCPCPVWIINADGERKFSRILAAIDADPTEAESLRLQIEVMKMGMSMAKRERAELDILYAWEIYYESDLRSPWINMSDDEIKALMKKEHATRKSWLNEIVEPFQDTGQEFHTHLLEGDASKVILEFIDKERSDLLIIGTVGRTGIPGMIIGNTAEAVIGKANCSILTIKPPDFITPVTI
jgi:nucleotide-binding universal stress UspA family protein